MENEALTVRARIREKGRVRTRVREGGGGGELKLKRERGVENEALRVRAQWVRARMGERGEGLQ